MTFMLVPRDTFLAFLAEGWGLPFIVEPAPGHHGLRAIILEKFDG